MEKLDEILKEASRCINCKKPLCSEQGCPIQSNIPEFIQSLKNKEFEKAYKILQDNNIMSEICSLICPAEEQCMSKCIQGIKENPIKINNLELFTNKWAEENKIILPIENNPKKIEKIAIIGAGPAGISCAVELIKKGYNVDIFEKEDKIGGILEYGIPDFRLEKEQIIKLEQRLKLFDINIKNNKTFGKDFNIKSLKEEGYKAIFLGIGLEQAIISDIKGNNIYTFNEILRAYYNKDNIKNLGAVAVVGGGNVALDTARVVKRMGAKDVKIIYRRRKEDMPAIKTEIQEALNEGIEIITNTIIKSYNNNSKEAICLHTRIIDGKVEELKGTEFTINIDNVVLAIGQKLNEKIILKENIRIENDLVKIDENGQTNIKGVFAGGDLVKNKSSVCKAIQSGKIAANGIHKYITCRVGF